MKASGYQVGIYGVITILGGVMGFVTAGSVISLVAGGVFGVLLLAGGYGLLTEATWGFWVSLVATVVLLIQFAPTFTRTGELMPAGLMSLLGIWILGVLIVAYLRQTGEDH